jgi:hypothetical protein
MKNKEGFYKTIAGYLRKGIMKPLYSSDTLAVLRVADAFYVASDYTVGSKGYITFLVNSKMVRAMMLDNSFLEQLATTSDRKTLADMMFELDSFTFQRFSRKSKDNPLTDLTHNFLDPQMEQWIYDTFGEPEIPAVQPEKKGFLQIFRKKAP